MAVVGLQVFDSPEDANAAIPSFVIDVLYDDCSLRVHQSVGADPFVDLRHLACPLRQVGTSLLYHAGYVRIRLRLECNGGMFGVGGDCELQTALLPSIRHEYQIVLARL